MNDWLLSNGTVVDGTGKPGYRADVLLADSRVASIGRPETGDLVARDSVRTIDCAGCVIAPGFIDAHSHSDLQVIEGRRDKLRQGVTTEVIGNCGFSAYPPAPNAAELREFAGGIFCGDDRWGWPSTDAYLAAVEKSANANAVSLVGHGTLRIAVAGNRQGRLTEQEVSRMESLLAECFAAGAAGFSTGLMYAPGSSAPTDELERLCEVTARHGKVYATHMRTYSEGLIDAIEEQLALARASGCRLQVSHLQAVGAANWPLHQRALETIENAANAGIDIAFDCYPYVAGSSVLTQLLPQWALDGGMSAMCARLRDSVERARIKAEIASTITTRAEEIYISAVQSDANQPLVGHNVQEIAEQRACEPVEAVFHILLEENGAANMLCFNQSEDNLRLSLTHPLAIVISDGFYVKGKPHPRLYGTFPFLLGTISRDRGWLTLEEAVRKITSLPAARFHQANAGVLTAGANADVTIFDPLNVDSPATYDNPTAAPVGIRHVFRNGEPVDLT